MRLASYAACLLGLLVVGAQPALAAPRRYSATINGDLGGLSSLVAKPARTGDRFRTIRLTAKNVYGVGRAQIVINRRKLPPAEAVLVRQGKVSHDQVVPALFQGNAYLNRAKGEARRVPVSLSVIKGNLSFQFTKSTGSEALSRARVFRLHGKLSAGRSLAVRATSKPNSALSGKECSAKAGPAKSAAAQVRAQDLTLFRLITLSTDADPEWYAKYGDASNAEIAAIVNAAEVVYQEQLGIRFAIVRQHVYADGSPYVDLDASALLASFKKNPENPANLGFNLLTFNDDVDAKYLFTGKELNGTTVGLSYIGAMCWSSKDAYGLVQDVYREINVSAFLHEMGHTLGAQHDVSDATGIMYPQLGLDRRHFSPTSLDQINRHLSFFGKCVDEQLMKPSVANARITMKRAVSKNGKNLLIKGNVVSALGTPLANQLVSLTLNKKTVVEIITDEQGAFSYSIKKGRFQGTSLTVQAQLGDDQFGTPMVLKIPLRA